MASTNKTAHLALNQWVGTDPFRMADFNEDNQKIDDAIANCGNCHIATGSYTGDGAYGKNTPTSLTFDFQPKLVCIQSVNGQYGAFFVYGTNGGIASMGSSPFTYILNATWNGNTLSWYHENGPSNAQYMQLSYSGWEYIWIAIY